MKKLLCLIAWGWGLFLATAQGQTTNVLVVWDAIPANVATNGAVVKIYHTTNATLPLTNWNLIATAPATRVNITATVTIGENYFVGTVSNFWGESFFSNTASTPPVIKAMTNNLRVVKMGN